MAIAWAQVRAHERGDGISRQDRSSGHRPGRWLLLHRRPLIRASAHVLRPGAPALEHHIQKIAVTGGTVGSMIVL